MSELDRTDFEIGIGRLIDRVERLVPLSTQRAFSLSDACVYGAVTAGSAQVGRIECYMRERGIPVYYTLYNPTRMPTKGVVPRLVEEPEDDSIQLGCRVLAAAEVHVALAALPAGKPPAFSELVTPFRAAGDDPYAAHGWRLEGFVADEVLRCHAVARR